MIDYRRIVLLAAVLLMATLPHLTAAEPAPSANRPNIVFVVADDLGINDLSCYGRRDQATPNLDRLATEGLRFTTAYAAQAVCSPTRAAIMTGKSPARLHLTTFLPGRPDTNAQLLLQPEINQQLPLSEITLAERLRPAGYVSACIGKWHLGGKGFLPTDQGFDSYYAGEMNTKPSETEGGKGEFDLTAHATEFITANRERPFFLYLAHNCPHIPLAARADLIEKHKDAFNPVYAAMIESLDASVGRLVAKIDELGLAERTLIIFTSDNGGLHVSEGPNTPSTHNTPYRAGKGFCYEGGLRIPLIVRWKDKVKGGQSVDTPVISTDWMPTLLAIAGVPASEFGDKRPFAQFDGTSLDGLILRGEALAVRPLYWHLPHYCNQGSRPAGAIREGDWKLIEQYEDGKLELFNLADDPGEATDVAAKHPNRVAELRGKLEAWRRGVSAQGNAANPSFSGTAWRKLYEDFDVSREAPDKKASSIAADLTPWRQLMNQVLPNAVDPPDDALPGAGAIILHARDAKVHGEGQDPKLRYEPEPHKDTLGYWVQADDWAEWEFDAPGAGKFIVEILQGCGDGSGGSTIEVWVGSEKVSTRVEETGHFQRFVPRRIGTITLDDGGHHTLALRAKAKPGPAVMDLRRITLRAAPE
jgi:arylsulfatase A-like enzyme